jgi:hypothetical protein
MKQQRSTLEKRNALEEGQKGAAVGRPSWRSSLLGDPGAKFLCEKLGIGTEGKKERKGKEGRRQFPQAPQPPSTPNLFQAAIHLRKAELLAKEWEAP